MVLFAIRVLAALGALAMGWFTPWLPWEVAWRVAAIFGTFAVVAFLLDRRRFVGPGTAGLFAAAEMLTLGALLASAGRIEQFGFAVLVPALVAIVRYGSNPLFLSPIAAAALIANQILFRPNDPPGNGLLAQAVIVMVLGLLLGRPKTVVREVVLEEEPPEPPIMSTEEILDLRESYRRLRSAYLDLDVRSKRDRLFTALADLSPAVPRFPERLAQRLTEITGVETINVFLVSETGNRLVVEGVSGDGAAPGASLVIDPQAIADEIRQRVDRAVRVLRSAEQPFANVPLESDGRVIGMLSLIDDDMERLEHARDAVEAASGALGAMLVEARASGAALRLRREAELLYEFTSLADGATDDAQLARRFVRELREMLGADSVGVWKLRGPLSERLALEGPEAFLLPEMSFAMGAGIPGWVESGRPELFLFDARDDDRVPSELALRLRVGSLLAIPIEAEGDDFGVLVVSTQQANGLDLGAAETARVATFEFGTALARLRGGPRALGVLTPKDFFALIQGQKGVLVHLDPLRKEQLVRTHGRVETARALRLLTKRIRTKLPRGGAVCRRPEGDVLVYLPGYNEARGQKWTNEMTAIASLIGIRNLDGTAKIPLALRGKVAVLHPQDHRITTEVGA